jgi:putative transcriptional regulator
MSKELYIVRNDLRELRRAKGLSQETLGRVLGVSRQTINSIEQGRYDPSLPLALRITRYFGTTIEEVFHDDGPCA